MTASFDLLWPKVRDVASWGLGAWWGNGLMADPSRATPWAWAIVAGLMCIPFAARADEMWRRLVERQPQPPPSTHTNGATAEDHAPL